MLPTTVSLVAVAAMAAVCQRSASAQGIAPTGPPGGITVAAIASSLTTDTARLEPEAGGDGPGKLGPGLQASAHLWLRGVLIGLEGSSAILKWTDSLSRRLGPETQFSFRENVGLGMIGVGWPLGKPVLVARAGAGLRGGSIRRGDNPAFIEEEDRNRFVWAAGVDLVLGRGRVVRPVVTARYIRAIRTPQEGSAGIGRSTFRLGVGIDLGRRE